MKLVLSQTDVEQKLTTLLRMEGLEVTNVVWSLENQEIELHMEFIAIPPKPTPDPVPEVLAPLPPPLPPAPAPTSTELQAVIDRLSQLETTATVINMNPEDYPQQTQTKRRSPKRRQKKNTPIENEENSLKTVHPRTGATGLRSLAGNESFEYPG